jgi:hypothetical protein
MRYAALAAEQADARHAYAAAAELWRQAIAAHGNTSDADPRQLVELWIGLVRTLGHAAAGQQAADARREAGPAGDAAPGDEDDPRPRFARRPAEPAATPALEAAAAEVRRALDFSLTPVEARPAGGGRRGKRKVSRPLRQSRP